LTEFFRVTHSNSSPSILVETKIAIHLHGVSDKVETHKREAGRIMNKMENQVDVFSMGRGIIPRMVICDWNLTVRKDKAVNG
jgi:hypothetical protein